VFLARGIDQVFQTLERGSGAGHDHHGDDTPAVDHGEVALCIVGQLGIDRRVDRQRATGAEGERIAIRQGFLAGHHAWYTRTVFHHDLVTPGSAQALGQHPRHHVRGLSRREGDDHANGLVGECRLCSSRQGAAGEQCRQAPGKHGTKTHDRLLEWLLCRGAERAETGKGQ
jgi:hypothetical protein